MIVPGAFVVWFWANRPKWLACSKSPACSNCRAMLKARLTGAVDIRPERPS